uniref:Uncharacterized protein n=1 Tax=viral metagenome TaxID=1070528 RepID=A0A6C0JGD8_9ZZZZ
MGGGSSQPITIKRTVTRPRPTDNTNRGIKVSDTEGCGECKLLIDKGVTAATAKITVNPEPTPDKDDPENLTVPDQTDTTGAKKVNPNIYIPSNSITIKPSAPFTGSFNTAQSEPYGVGEIQWDEMDLFWGAPIRVENSTGGGAQADACLLVRSTSSYLILMIPIQKTSDATKKGAAFFNKITPPLLALAGASPAAPGGYDPNDDAHISDAWKKLGAGDATAVANSTAIKAYIKYASDGHYDTGATRVQPPPYQNTTIDTGSDWALSSLVEGNEAYFTWIASVYSRNDDTTETEDKGVFRYETHFKKFTSLTGASNATVGKLSPRIVYFQEPVFMLETDFAVLRGTVKARAPGEIVQEIITDPPPKAGEPPRKLRPNPRRVFYHPACCGAKGAKDGVSKPSVAQTFAKMQNQQLLDVWNTEWFQYMLAAFILILMFVALSWLLTYVNEVPDNIFSIVGRLITGRPKPPS